MEPASNEGASSTRGSCDVLAARLRVNAATEIRVLAQEYGGGCSVHIRQYYLGDGDQFLPTQKGVSLPIIKLDDVLDAVRELRDAQATPGTVAVVEKNAREEVRFAVATWEGTTKADIRTYFTKSGANERQPGKGVRFNLGLLPDLERALETLDRAVNG